MTMDKRRLPPLAVSVLVLGVTAAGSGAVAATWPGPPRTSSPQVAGAKIAPPPAWVETPQHSTWLAYSSYCWSLRGNRRLRRLPPSPFADRSARPHRPRRHDP